MTENLASEELAALTQYTKGTELFKFIDVEF